MIMKRADPAVQAALVQALLDPEMAAKLMLMTQQPQSQIGGLLARSGAPVGAGLLSVSGN